MSPILSSQTNGSTEVAPSQDWLRSSVQQFFSGFNWDDHSPELQEIKLTALNDTAAPLSLTLSVSQFFAAMNWSGTTIAAPVPTQQPVAPPADDLTLDDFSSLF